MFLLRTTAQKPHLWWWISEETRPSHPPPGHQPAAERKWPANRQLATTKPASHHPHMPALTTTTTTQQHRGPTPSNRGQQRSYRIEKEIISDPENCLCPCWGVLEWEIACVWGRGGDGDGSVALHATLVFRWSNRDQGEQRGCVMVIMRDCVG